MRNIPSGIQADKQAKLFVPFERLGAQQTSVEGTGLGLAVSKRLLEVMKGSIGAENNPDRGATFWMELPLAPDPVPQVETAIGGVPVAAEPVAGQRDRVVLYIEDNLSNLTLIEDIIVHRPHVKLLAAMQGRLGLDLARAAAITPAAGITQHAGDCDQRRRYARPHRALARHGSAGLSSKAPRRQEILATAGYLPL